MKRFHIVFKGRVQGVGFRWTLINIAQKYNLTGFCENLINGDVDVEIQGNPNNLDSFLKETLETKRYIRIDDYLIKQIDVVLDERVFDVKY